MQVLTGAPPLPAYRCPQLHDVVVNDRATYEILMPTVCRQVLPPGAPQDDRIIYASSPCRCPAGTASSTFCPKQTASSTFCPEQQGRGSPRRAP